MEKQVKKVNGIKLNQLRENELEKREMNSLKGGSWDCNYWCGVYSGSEWGVSYKEMGGDLKGEGYC